MMGLYIKGCSNKKSLVKNFDQERAYYNERINAYIINNDQLVSEKALLISDGKSLDDKNKELANEVDYWKKKKSKVTTVTKTEIEYRDTGSTKTILVKLPDNEYKLSFSYKSDDSVLFVNGHSIIDAKNETLTVGNTVFDSTLIRIVLTLGFKEDNDKIKRAYVTLPNDKFVVTKIDAVEIDNELNRKKSRLSIGFNAGVGVNYSPFTKRAQAGVQGGVGVNYNF